ncbi:MAG: MBL fold metallo-hydrolase [Chloroflexi bacterium]|nr:MBL fold metallo-hydrolase [Chloroflexota bacterium]
MQIRPFVDEGLGNTCHLVIAERAGVGALIDPLRDVDRYVEAAAAAGVRVTHVLETHVHNDFISGSRELAARTGALICASAAAGLQFEHRRLRHADEVIVGDVKLSVLETPGHTPEHVSFLARDMAEAGQPAALFSGGSLLVGAVSRTDLLGHEHTVGLTRQLYYSLHEKILRLADDVAVYPTHGAGSFCAAAPGSARSTTIGQERLGNPFVRAQTFDDFLHLARQMPSYPAYYRNMAPLNRHGPRVLGGVPELPPLSPDAVHERLRRGEAVVDLRPVARYLEGHIPGVYHVELRPAFASWVGWLVPFGLPVVLVSDTTAVHDEAVRQLIRIGYDDLPGYLEGGMAAWERAGLPVARLPVLTVEEVRARLWRGEPLVVLDVRQDAEWAAGHVPDAQHVEGGRLVGQAGSLARDRQIVAHCGHEARGASALSLLERAGHRDLALMWGGFEAWQQAGLPVDAGVSADERGDEGDETR